MKWILPTFFTGLLLTACSEPQKERSLSHLTDESTTLFTKIPAVQSGITFENKVEDSYELNFLNFPYIYTGSGVAIGDIDNDGLEDIFLASNFGSDKLYKNKGNLKFDDISMTAGISRKPGYSSGVSMIDVNNDGWLDIYVCRGASLQDDEARKNLLWINQQDGTFKEQSREYGLDDPAYSTQAYPLDYDKDGDLDIYLVNYRNDFTNNTKVRYDIQTNIDQLTSDHLYRNDGGKFTKVTAEADLYSKAWGLAAVIGDFNNDSWPDIYVANDFLEPDFLFINQQDGTFANEILDRFKHISFNSMGADYADLNNDLLPDLITLDMAAENYARSKENMASMSTENFMNLVQIGYHHAYMANMLQYNQGNGQFKETGQLSGITKTDWSWAPLLADLNNDGLKDIFVTNGVMKDHGNQDFRRLLAEKNAAGESMSLESVVAMMPAEKLDNYVFQNNGDLTFSKAIEEWGLEDPTFSNGAAYADLDNDGDLDLVISNINDQIGLYRNNAYANYLQVELQGSSDNPFGIGAEVIVQTAADKQHQQLYLARGFESSVSRVLQFGLGDGSQVDQVTVKWPDGRVSQVSQPGLNQRLVINHNTAKSADDPYSANTNLAVVSTGESKGIDFSQQENDFDDYALQLLLPQKQSTKGGSISKADVNNDGLEDFFVGNATGAAAALFVQTSNGQFKRSNQALWEREAAYEDAGSSFLDADGDGDMDLYVVSAGYELGVGSPLLQDRLYLNDGRGNFRLASNALPTMLTSGKVVVAGDYDQDGDTDLFVGGNVVPGQYPVAPESYLLQNEGGRFSNALNPDMELSRYGMISDAVFTDYDQDNDLDLLIVGEWMAPTFFENDQGGFTRSENLTGLDNSNGWWFSVTAADMDQDGDQDYILGNLGMNNKFHPSPTKPLSIHAKDFDDNGSFDVAMSKISDGKIVPIRGKECSSQQNPYLLDKVKTYKEFASLEFADIYGEEVISEALVLEVHGFKSVYLENLGGGQFSIKPLDNKAQTGPTLGTEVADIDGDGNMDILGIGAIYDAEVETIRYDANYGYVLLGDGQGNFKPASEYRPLIAKDSKDLCAISIAGRSSYLVLSSNSTMDIVTFNP